MAARETAGELIPQRARMCHHPARLAAPGIVFVFGLVCPWCFIGLRRLETALADVPEPNLRFHPFQLDPSTPAEGRDLRSHLGAKFGDPTAMFARVEQVARESGI